MGIPLQIYTLGGLRIQKGEETVTGLETRKVAALLVYLAATRRAHPREVLAELFWEERSQGQSLVNLRVALTSLRKHLGDYLEASRENAGLRPGAEVWLDAAEMEETLGALRAGQAAETARAAEELDRAIALYRGEFLEGFTVRDCPWFESWQRRERERLHLLAAGALHDRVAYSLQSGDTPAGIAHATRLLALDPLMESAHRQMMQLLALSGKRALALKQYETLRQTLERELGVEPESESRALYEDIRAGRYPGGAARPSAPLQTKDKPRHNLPRALTPFFGRENELQELSNLLEDPGRRVVTLAGPGGIGKTRLAIQAAESLLPAFPQGAWFVPLASLASPEFLAETTGAALELSFSGLVPPKEQLLESLRHKEMLLVLDNFEHLLPKGTQLLVEILRKAPGVKLLVTSRQRLNLQAEWVLEVQGLETPKNGRQGDLEDYPAAALFLEHARRAAGVPLPDEDRNCVGHITRLVEGAPLALELAASWARVISCREIAGEIEKSLGFLQARQPDLPARHRSMHAVFDHSWELLTEEERSVFRKLSVFRGGFERQAAVQVAGASLAALAGLVDKSFLYHRPDGRYRIHELLRQYAGEALERAGGTGATRERHLVYYQELAQQAEPELWREQEKAWMDRLERELDNLRSALEWSLSPSSKRGAQAGLRLLLSSAQFWWSRGHLNEAPVWLAALMAQPQAAEDQKLYADGLRQTALWKEWVYNEIEAAQESHETCLALAEGLGDARLLAHALSDFGNFHMNWGDLAAAEKYLDRSLALYREVGDDAGVGVVLRRMGNVSHHRKNDHPAARSYYQQSLAVWRKIGNQSNRASTLLELSRSYRSIGQYAEAESFLDECIAVSREVNDHFFLSSALLDRGLLEFNAGEITRAVTILEECLEISRDKGFKISMAWSFANLGMIALYQGDYPKALSLLEEALAIFQAFGHVRGQYVVLAFEAFVFFYLGDEAHALELFKESLALSISQEDGLLESVFDLIGLAGLSTLDEQPDRAARLLGAAEALAEPLNLPLEKLRAVYAEYKQILAQVRGQLEESAFTRFCQEGREMASKGPDQILAYVEERN